MFKALVGSKLPGFKSYYVHTIWLLIAGSLDGFGVAAGYLLSIGRWPVVASGSIGVLCGCRILFLALQGGRKKNPKM